jgi:hypothetical protein
MRIQTFAFCLTLLLTSARAFSAVYSAPAETTLWYNGDDWAVGGGGSGGGAANEISSNRGYFKAYDEFNVTASGWNVTRIWSNNDMRVTGVTQASWEIRTGMGPGVGGSILASGISPATQTATGRYNVGPEYTISVSGLDLLLPSGTYWLNVTPFVGSDPGTGGYLNSYTAFTSGANAVGTPAGNNANGLLDWTDSYAPFMAVGWDLSMGVAGTVVPEPSTACLVLIGTVMLGRNRLRRAANPGQPSFHHRR